MNRGGKITINLKGIQDLKKSLGNTFYTKIGILASGKAADTHYGAKHLIVAGKRYRAQNQDVDTGISNVELGIIHEFGTDKIPARSFLRMPLEMKAKEIIAFLKSPMVKKLLLAGQRKKVHELLGVKGEEIVQQAFSTQGFGKWQPNAPATVAAKGSSSPLIDTAQLRRAITSEVVRKQNG